MSCERLRRSGARVEVSITGLWSRGRPSLDHARSTAPPLRCARASGSAGPDVASGYHTSASRVQEGLANMGKFPPRQKPAGRAMRPLPDATPCSTMLDAPRAGVHAKATHALHASKRFTPG